MCGIISLFGDKRIVPGNMLNHRGPDDYHSVTLGKCQMDFYRLSINDISPAGMQPFVGEGHMFMCNGEIYNHKQYETGNEKSKSDCEVVMNMINKLGMMKTVESLNGDFAMVYTDGERVLAARDPVGVRPMFYTRYSSNSIAFASEAKALLFLESHIEVFPPGYIYDSYVDNFICYHSGYWDVQKHITNYTIEDVRSNLEKAVHLRLENTDREIGFLLSGGLDSSLIASIAQKRLGTIKTFSVGLDGSPDLKAARRVAKYLGSDHTEVIFTVEEGVANLQNVIDSLESYDTTTVRASTPMWLLCKYIKENTNCRYIFSGEGSDELLGGYLYFHGAPNVDAFAYENMRRLKLIHQFDGLRADRCAGAHGLDLVVPFLDKHFIDCCMSINQNMKMTKLEKQLLRDAFIGYLPDEILWRQKDGMSDAVGSGWVSYLKEYTESQITEFMFENLKSLCHHNIPLTKEEAYYRQLFWNRYGSNNDHLISEIWRPKWTSITDPSARLLIE
jgi:asparagine synthase (glutamine-hydrolysing)|tara:strand:- start:1177 stop:2685 length:1509 start_codon:yes stop_codon:yes gene_type:complete